MVSTMQLESFGGGVVNWNWAKASKIKSGLRAPRRPKVYSAENKRKTVGISLKESENVASKSSKLGEMSVIESEKLGVSILGRRFRDSIQNVPIKKRRLLQLKSPPLCLPSHPPQASGCSLPCEDSVSAHHSEMAHHFNEEHRGSNSERRDSGLEENVTNENNKWETHDTSYEGADFSGISILAAAACNSSAGDIISSKALVTREQDEDISHLISGKAKSHVPQVNKFVDQHLDNSSIIDGKTRISAVLMDTSVPCKEVEDRNAMGKSEILEEQLSNSLTMLLNTNETVNKASSAREERFQWDLNKEMDTRGVSDVGLFDSKNPLIDSSSKDAAKPDGVSAVQMGPESVKRPSKLDGDIFWNDKLIDKGCLVEQDLLFNHGNVAECNTENHSPSVLMGDSAQSEHFASEDLNNVADEKLISNNSRDFHGLAERDLLFNNGNVAECNTENHSPSAHTGDSSQSKYFAPEDLNNIANEKPVSNKCTDEYVDCDAVISSGGQNVDHSHQTVAFEDCLKSNCETASEILHSHLDFIGTGCTTVTDHQSVVDHLANHPAKESIVQDSENAMPIDIFNKLSEDIPVNEHANSTQKLHKQLADTLRTDSEAVSVIFPGDPHMSAALNSDSVINKLNKPATSTWNIYKQPDDTLAFDSNTVASTWPGDPDMSTLLTGDSTINNKSSEQFAGADSCTKGADDPDKLKMQVQKCTSVNVSPKSRDLVNNSATTVDSVDSCPDCGPDSLPSHYSLEQQTETENGELHGDDSQYEDGEFREYTLLDWQLDGEEGEAEHVDYGSDSIRDAEPDAASPSCPSFVGQLTSCNTGYKSEKPLEDDDLPHGYKISKHCMKVVSEPHQSSNIRKEKKKHLQGKVAREHNRRNASEQSSRGVSDNKQVCLNSKIVVSCKLYSENNGGNEEQRHGASFKLKSSGWDCLQEHSKATRDAVVDSRTNCNKTNQSGAADKYAESCRQAGSMPSLDLPSRIERLKSSESLRRKDHAFILGKRVDPDEPSTSVERDDSHISFTRRNGAALHRHKKGGRPNDTRDGSSSQWGLKGHESLRKYESSRFNQSNLKNASYASTVKVKSNGFNVALDGTVIETRSGSMGCVRQASRQNVNPSLQVPHSSLPKEASRNQRNESLDLDRYFDLEHSREVSPDGHGSISRGRSGRYDPRVVNSSHRGRYTGPAIGDGMDSSLPSCHTFSPREHNYSSQRNSIHKWTRSPHGCTSTGRKDDGGVNDLRRWSKSPNFRFAARGERMRSPHQQPGYMERMPDIVTSCKSNISLPHASRWIGRRKDIENGFSKHECRWLSGRNPPNRIFPQSHRLDMENGRIKAEEYYYSIDPGRFHDFSVNRRPRFGGHGDRGHGNGCEIFSSPSARYGVDDDMKHLTCDIGDGINPLSRKFSRNHMFDMDNEEIKEEEFHHSSDPGRFRDFSVSRRPRFGGRGDREHESRYEMFNSPSAQYDIVDDVKHLTYGIDDGFRLNNTQFKGGSHFNGRGSPREFDQGGEDYIDSPPRRRGHERHLRYDREARQNCSFRSFRIRECDESMTQRRRLS